MPENPELKDKIRQCNEMIVSSKTISISTHINPDGDAIGSALALYYYLKSKGKEVKIINPSETAYNLLFLTGAEDIIVYSPECDEYLDSCDTNIIVDLNDIDRLKELGIKILKTSSKKIVIDHHLDPKPFADLYVIDTESCSAGEIVYRIINEDKNYQISKEIASALYVAIMTDTGSFRFPRTTGEVHRIIGAMIDAGADPVEIYDQVYNKVPLRAMRLLGEGLSGIETFNDGRLGVVTIKNSMLDRCRAKAEDVEDFVEKILSIDGIKVGILITEEIEKDQIRISFRSKGEYGIRDLAVSMGGGGHYYAAGARVDLVNIDLLKNSIVEKASKLFI